MLYRVWHFHWSNSCFGNLRSWIERHRCKFLKFVGFELFEFQDIFSLCPENFFNQSCLFLGIKVWAFWEGQTLSKKELGRCSRTMEYRRKRTWEKFSWNSKSCRCSEQISRKVDKVPKTLENILKHRSQKSQRSLN